MSKLCHLFVSQLSVVALLFFSPFGYNRYMERDPVRGKDSFAAFEEMLLLAKEKKVNLD